MSDVARKRLSAIREFTEFGSGFKIAMRDLEIRGAGNILGAQQHGHMDAVGYDMYCRILKESIDEMQGKVCEEQINVRLDLHIDAYIPESYIENHNQRIDVYKRIAAIENDEDASEVTDELCDRYGDPPRAVRCLTEVAKIKAFAKKLGITSLSQKEGKLDITFARGQFDAAALAGTAMKLPTRVRLISGENPRMIFKLDNSGITANIKFLLQTIFELKNEEK